MSWKQHVDEDKETPTDNESCTYEAKEADAFGAGSTATEETHGGEEPTDSHQDKWNRL